MTSLHPLPDGPVFDLLAQSSEASSVKAAAAAGIGIVALLFVLSVCLVVWVFVCFCLKRICEKAGHEPGVLIWIPILNLVPQLNAAKLPVWMIVLLIIPIIQIPALVYLFWKLCEARGKPGPLGLLMLIPPANLGLICWLAFAD